MSIIERMKNCEGCKRRRTFLKQVLASIGLAFTWPFKAAKASCNCYFSEDCSDFCGGNGGVVAACSCDGCVINCICKTCGICCICVLVQYAPSCGGGSDVFPACCKTSGA